MPPARKPPYNQKHETRAVRGFLIALRALKVPDAVAVTLAREAGVHYSRHAHKGDYKRANEYVSQERAEFLADQLNVGLMP